MAVVFEKLKESIADVVKDNGNKEITGNALQEKLFEMVDAMSEIGGGGGNTFTEVQGKGITLIKPDAFTDGQFSRDSLHLLNAEEHCGHRCVEDTGMNKN